MCRHNCQLTSKVVAVVCVVWCVPFNGASLPQFAPQTLTHIGRRGDDHCAVTVTPRLCELMHWQIYSAMMIAQLIKSMCERVRPVVVSTTQGDHSRRVNSFHFKWNRITTCCVRVVRSLTQPVRKPCAIATDQIDANLLDKHRASVRHIAHTHT